MRARIDIIDVEGATKIRAKYLRALENEEWALLPGPTFVKSFLRTYAEYLGLDARLLVEDYKHRFERPSEVELRPLSAPRARERERPRGPIGPPPVSRRALTILAIVVVVFVGFYVLGEWGGTTPPAKSPLAPTATETQATAAPPKRTKPTTPSRATLTLLPTGSVYVCLLGPHGRKLIPGVQLNQSSPRKTFTADRMLLTVGNGNLRMKVNGRTLGKPASDQAVNFVITPRGRYPRGPGKGADCS